MSMQLCMATMIPPGTGVSFSVLTDIQFSPIISVVIVWLYMNPHEMETNFFVNEFNDIGTTSQCETLPINTW